MNAALLYQLRLSVSPEYADALRADPSGVKHPELGEILRRHDATLICQYDAFANYVSEAERLGTQHYPLYQWTRDTIENPEKKARYLRSFTVYVNGEQVYAQEVADHMETELLKLVGQYGVTGVSKFDTNPANSPQPPRTEP
ncbi:hypothetical protein AAGS40_16175 [Paraburkholderia sp. PREW-6R]|uniref:hypothetical protein n=1 Tax=Paraburkholderia sp. PREW-6R TaxID=3141544 RepID=UPI0031F4A66A